MQARPTPLPSWLIRMTRSIPLARPAVVPVLKRCGGGRSSVGTLAGRNLIDEHNIAATRAAIRFPRPVVSAPPLPAGSNVNIPGLSSFVTPDDSFYRVDTALLVPQVAPATWRLGSTGWCNVT